MKVTDKEWIELVKLAQQSGKTKEEFEKFIEDYQKDKKASAK